MVFTSTDDDTLGDVTGNEATVGERGGLGARCRKRDYWMPADDAQCVMTNCTIRYGGGYGPGRGDQDRERIPDVTGNDCGVER